MEIPRADAFETVTCPHCGKKFPVRFCDIKDEIICNHCHGAIKIHPVTVEAALKIEAYIRSIDPNIRA